MDYLIELEKKYIAKLITTEKDSFRINSFFRNKVIVVPIEVKFQEKIELTRTGKHQAVLSKIPIDFQQIKKSLGL